MRVLTIGSAMVDTIAIIDSGRIERMTMLNADSSFLLLAEGRKTEAVEISTHSGGAMLRWRWRASEWMLRCSPSLIAYLRALTELGPKYEAVIDGARGAFVASHKEIIF
jgi:hypothetical protein